MVKHLRKSRLDVLLGQDLAKYNPTLKSVLRVERLFSENLEFRSKSQLLRNLDGTMKAPVLNVILKYLKELGKVMENDDGSWTWIYAANNRRLRKSYNQSVRP
ncbi:MAG: hypothetical protein WAO91_04435 [Candidatus Nitrosotenuis sp.]